MIETRTYDAKDLKEERVKKDIRSTLLTGRLVVFPTETVYGIGAYALSSEGIANIYNVKGRPSDNPLIMHMKDAQAITPYVYIDQPYIKDLIDAFWPGPLTMVFRKKESVPTLITGGLSTVGVRIPSHPVAQDVLTIADVPICAPSANISGRPSATLFEHVMEDFNHRVDIIIDGGKSDVGLESTVLDVTGDVPVILRPGVITQAMLETIVPKVLRKDGVKANETPASPGMKYKHYAPRGELTIVEGDQSAVVRYINDKIKDHHDKHKKVGVITSDALIKQFNTTYVYNLGDASFDSSIASNLYIGLRMMDQFQVDYIYSVAFHGGSYQEAIMNRLYKAANHKIVKL